MSEHDPLPPPGYVIVTCSRCEQGTRWPDTWPPEDAWCGGCRKLCWEPEDEGPALGDVLDQLVRS